MPGWEEQRPRKVERLQYIHTDRHRGGGFIDARVRTFLTGLLIHCFLSPRSTRFHNGSTKVVAMWRHFTYLESHLRSTAQRISGGGPTRHSNSSTAIEDGSRCCCTSSRLQPILMRHMLSSTFTSKVPQLAFQLLGSKDHTSRFCCRFYLRCMSGLYKIFLF